ncbi:MAG TPA: LLM class F420-dependent oxidoreductase [Mycobacteriales bacterium]|nr:LLM class F420-dependent oxidoreductase [Mycobacteriales bacterium]
MTTEAPAAAPDIASWAARIGPVGVWTGQLDYAGADGVRAAAREVESLGYAALWTGEAVGREVLSAAQLLLAATDSLVVATGIANVWARDALATAAGQLALGEAYPDRFVLGIGVSHKPLLDVRGEDYRRPLTYMRDYLDGMDAGYAVYRAVQPASRPPRLLAALGPKMLELARDRADGAHTYFVPPEHTATAREILGPGKLLVPEQVCVLSEDPAIAREIARRHTTSYLRLPNYTANLGRFGFEATDFADGGNDRLVDTICAWGDVETVRARVQAHLDAGADHVAVQVLVDDRRGLPRKEWAELAPGLLHR